MAGTVCGQGFLLPMQAADSQSSSALAAQEYGETVINDRGLHREGRAIP